MQYIISFLLLNEFAVLVTITLASLLFFLIYGLVDYWKTNNTFMQIFSSSLIFIIGLLNIFYMFGFGFFGITAMIFIFLISCLFFNYDLEGIFFIICYLFSASNTVLSFLNMGTNILTLSFAIICSIVFLFGITIIPEIIFKKLMELFENIKIYGEIFLEFLKKQCRHICIIV